MLTTFRSDIFWLVLRLPPQLFMPALRHIQPRETPRMPRPVRSGAKALRRLPQPKPRNMRMATDRFGCRTKPNA